MQTTPPAFRSILSGMKYLYFLHLLTAPPPPFGKETRESRGGISGVGREEEGRLRPVAKKDPGLRSPSLQYTNYAFPEKVFLFPFFPRAELVALSSHFLTLSSAALVVHHTDGVALHVGRRACKLWPHLATKTPPPSPSELKRGKVLREESTRQGGRRCGEILAAKLEIKTPEHL